jgi:hypothetical protein
VNREAALVAILALLAASGLWAAPHGPAGHEAQPQGTSTSSTGTTSSPGPAIVLPFAEGKAVDGGNLTFLVLAPRGKAAALDAVNHSASPIAAEDLEWQGSTLAFYRTPVSSCPPRQACDPYWAFGPWPLPRFSGVPKDTRPLLGVDGFNGTRITVHVFDETGLLAATNAPANQTAAFGGGSRPEQLPGGVWYVGANATAPNGTQPIPPLARPLFGQLLPMMRGLPVGGVASVRSDAYASLYGTLYVTVRIDGLVAAP